MRNPEDCHLLIVDDEEDICSVLETMLSMHRYQVSTANSASEAMEIVSSGPVDLVISDIRMPEEDGVQLLKRIREYNDRIPIVALMTGYSDYSSEECLQMGAAHVFTKPFNNQDLLDSIERLLSPSS